MRHISPNVLNSFPSYRPLRESCHLALKRTSLYQILVVAWLALVTWRNPFDRITNVSENGIWNIEGAFFQIKMTQNQIKMTPLEEDPFLIFFL